MNSPFFSPVNQEDALFYFQMDGGFPGSNLDKDSWPSDPYPTGRHTRAPERTRKWRPDHGEAIVPSVSVVMPVMGCHFTLSFLKQFKLSVTWAWHHEGWVTISSDKKRKDQSFRLTTTSRICRQTESHKYECFFTVSGDGVGSVFLHIYMSCGVPVRS